MGRRCAEAQGGKGGYSGQRPPKSMLERSESLGWVRVGGER